MPNLMHFYFRIVIQKITLPFSGGLLYAHKWQTMLEYNAPHLSKFEFDITTYTMYHSNEAFTIDTSFEYFVKKCVNWNIIIDRWIFNNQSREVFVMLRTLNYRKHKTNLFMKIPVINIGSFTTWSTVSNNHHLFYSDIEKVSILITQERPGITLTSPRFQQIKHLIVEISTMDPWMWVSPPNIDEFNKKLDNVAKQNVTYLSYFVQLLNVSKIEFGSTFDISRWKDAQFILQACSNIIHLIIRTELLVSSEFINSSYLIPIFKQIKSIKSINKRVYFPSNLTLKLVQHFPLLTHIELEVCSFDDCVSIIEIFLSWLKNLSYLKIKYYEDTVRCNPFSYDYILEKRRQICTNNIFHQEMIDVKNDEGTIEIWLS
ncbi:unnamed protein product [Rotaria sp. Silwood1]|nr:unnamed protein product [Rotaria sp. Silwood1]CAF1680222.1 unnamed protein product [Rotaria sp. Silwood1]